MPRSSSQTSLPSSVAAKLRDRRHVHARICVDEKRLPSGEKSILCVPSPSVSTVRPAAVEVHAAIVDVIRVLPGMDAAGAEPDLPLLLVDAVHAADHPLALVIWFFTLPGLRRRKDRGGSSRRARTSRSVRWSHPRSAENILPRVVDECLALLVDDRPDLAGRRIHRQQPQHLVPALVEDEGEAARVGRPAVVVDAPRVVEQLVIERDLLFGLQIEELRPSIGSGSPGLR